MLNYKRITMLFLAVTLVFCTLPRISAEAQVTSITADNISAKIIRLGGTDRFDTAVRISGEGWSASETVFIANPFVYADALAGAPLAYAYDAPILLADDSSLDKLTAELKRLGTKSVLILGGASAISEKVEGSLKDAGYKVERLWGNTRYETSVKIAEKLSEKAGKTGDIFIASGVNYPDALSASPAAALKGSPILYSPANGKLDDGTVRYIKSHNTQKAYILGGTTAIGEDVSGKLSEAGIASLERLGGSDRYATSLLISKSFDALYKSGDISLATGKNFPDALAGSVFAAKMLVPVLLTDNATKDNELASYIAGKTPKKTYIFGGKTVVSDEIADYYIHIDPIVPTSSVTSSSATTTTTTTMATVSDSDTVSPADINPTSTTTTATTVASSDPDTITVYLDTIVYRKGLNKGSVFHISSVCSGMQSPYAMTYAEANEKGLRPCEHCCTNCVYVNKNSK